MISTSFKKIWGFIKEVSGDDAYERYLKHYAQCHPNETPLDRKEFFKQEQERKWNSIKRCC